VFFGNKIEEREFLDFRFWIADFGLDKSICINTTATYLP